MSTTPERWPFAFMAVGSAGIAVTSACYALSPPALALPIPPSRWDEAVRIAGEGAHRVLELGGTVGVPADLLFSVAALALAMSGREAHERLGWSMAALSALVFTVVDAMAARCLVPGPGFIVAKGLFDALFIAGTFAFGVGTWLVFWSQRARALSKALLAVATLGLVSSLAALVGADIGQGLGISIGAGIVLYATVGLSGWLRPVPALSR